MIRILHIIGRMDRAGAETMVMNLYRVIDKTKFQFDFLYFTEDKCDFDDEISALGGIIYRIPFSEFANPISRMIALYNLLKENKQFQIIHCHTLFSNAFHLFAGKMAGIPVRIAHSHSTNDEKYQNTKTGWLYKKISKFAINKYATHFIACGAEAQYFLFSKQKFVIQLPNAIDLNAYSKIGETYKKYIREFLNLENDTIVLIQIGRLNNIKNHQFTIRLIEYLKGIKIKAHLVIVGQGEFKDKLENQVNSKGLMNEITFLGIRSDIPKLFAGSDIMLMPSLYEGFPVVLVESQATGIPALISDCISREVDLGVGLVEFLSLADNFDSWANKILELQNNSKLDTKTRISIISEKGFDIHISVNRLEQLYSVKIAN